MKKTALLLMLALIGLTACNDESKAFDPNDVINDIQENGMRAPMYVELEENCRNERESGVVDGKHCHALAVTDERLRDIIDTPRLQGGGLEY